MESRFALVGRTSVRIWDSAPPPRRSPRRLSGARRRDPRADPPRGAASLRPLLCLAAFALALWPHWRWAAARLGDGSDDPLGLAALAVLAVAIARLAPRLRAEPAPGLARRWRCCSPRSPPCSACSRRPSWRRVLAALAFAAALAAFAPAGTPVLPLAGLATLALPVVSSLQFYAGYPLRLVTAEASRWLLGLAGFDASREGSAMLVDGRLVIVDAPCSGVQMVWMAWFCACAVACWRGLPDRAFARRLAFVGAIVLAGNIVRNALLVGLEARRRGVALAARGDRHGRARHRLRRRRGAGGERAPARAAAAIVFRPQSVVLARAAARGAGVAARRLRPDAAGLAARRSGSGAGHVADRVAARVERPGASPARARQRRGALRGAVPRPDRAPDRRGERARLARGALADADAASGHRLLSRPRLPHRRCPPRARPAGAALALLRRRARRPPAAGLRAHRGRARPRLHRCLVLVLGGPARPLDRPLAGDHGGDAARELGHEPRATWRSPTLCALRRGASRATRFVRAVALAFAAVLGIALAAGAVLLATALYALRAAPGDWSVRAAIGPLGVSLSVPALVRVATHPLGIRLLDGRSLVTRHGTLHARAGATPTSLIVRCAPCLIDSRQLAARPVRIEEIEATHRARRQQPAARRAARRPRPRHLAGPARHAERRPRAQARRGAGGRSGRPARRGGAGGAPGPHRGPRRRGRAPGAAVRAPCDRAAARRPDGRRPRHRGADLGQPVAGLRPLAARPARRRRRSVPGCRRR